MSRLVTLPPDIVEKCRKFGKELEAHYLADGSPQSAKYAFCVIGKPGELDAERFAISKMGECAAAVVFFVPFTEIKFTVEDGPDDGFDFSFLGIRADVKTTKPHHNLIWPVTLNDAYQPKKFDVLVSVSYEKLPPDDSNAFWVDGWVTKADFLENKSIAEGRHVRPYLYEGTWYLSKRHPVLHQII